MLGIHETNGDTMKVCFDPKGKEYPTGFSSKAGPLAAMVLPAKQQP